jgi:hypothetical protein
MKTANAPELITMSPDCDVADSWNQWFDAGPSDLWTHEP